METEEDRSTRSGSAADVSCEICKQRKVKCDRRKPVCAPCARTKASCEYKDRKKPGLRAGYGRELEARLDRLEGILVSQQNVIQQLIGSLPGAAAGKAPPGQPSTPSTTAAPNASQTLDRQQEACEYAMPTMPNMVDESSQNDGMEMMMNNHNQLRSWISTTADASFGTPASNRTLNESLCTGDLLPTDMLYELTEMFLTHINPWCPILHRETTLRTLFGSIPLDDGNCMVLHAITATSLKFSTDSRLTEAVRHQIHTTSKHKVLLYGLEHVSVQALQAMTILALDIVGNSNGPPGWNILALITRNVVQLGLSVEQTSSLIAPLSPSIYTLRAVVLSPAQSMIEDESRRRLFWMIYILDRYATVSTAFDFAISDKDIDRRLPCRDELLAPDSPPVDTGWLRGGSDERHSPNDPGRLKHIGALGHYIELLDILTQIHCFLKAPVDIGARSDVEEWQRQYLALDAKLSSWRHSLPGEFGNLSRLFNTSLYKDPVDCMWVMLQCTYYTTIIRLHSSAAYPATRSHVFQPSFTASQRCLSAVDDICALCTYVTDTGMLDRLGPPFAFSVWVAARVLLVAGSMAQNMSPAIHSLVNTLSKIGIYWKVAERYAILLRRVLDEYQESQASPSATRETPSSLQIVSDMRRCAYDLDYLISAQPRASTADGSTVRPGIQSSNELMSYDMSFDMFGFFNMPRVAIPNDAGTADSGMDNQYQANFDYQNLPGSDWPDWVVQ